MTEWVGDGMGLHMELTVNILMCLYAGSSYSGEEEGLTIGVLR